MKGEERMSNKVKIGIRILVILIMVTLLILGWEKTSYTITIEGTRLPLVGEIIEDMDTGLVYRILNEHEVAVESYVQDSGNILIPPMISIEMTNPDEQTSGAKRYDVTEIRWEAFKGRTIESISIPNSVRTIQTSAFTNSIIKNLSIIGNNLSIEMNAFQNTHIDTAVINGGASNRIKEVAFQGSVIQNLELQGPLVDSFAFRQANIRNLKISNQTIMSYNSFSDTQIGKLEFQDNTREIGQSAFANCSIEELTLPRNVQVINQAFRETQIYQLLIREVGIARREWFEGARIHTITIGRGINEIEPATFASKGIEELILDGSEIYVIGEEAFAYNGLSKNIIFENGARINVIGKKAFYDTRMTELNIPGTVQEIQDYAFADNVNLQSVEIERGVYVIGNNAFQNTGIQEINIPNTVNEIGNFAFSNNSNLNTVTLEEGVQIIGSNAFENTGIRTITIPGTVRQIKEGAFANNPYLETAILEQGVNYLGREVFENDSALKKIVLNNSINQIDMLSLPNENTKLYCNSNTYVSNYLQQNIPTNNIVLDDNGPMAQFSPNGTTKPIDTDSIQVTIQVSDIVGIKEDSLKVLFTTDGQTPGESQFRDSFQNGQTLGYGLSTSFPSQSETIYIWVLAEDLLGNKQITKSQVFQIDRVGPRISFSPDGNDFVQKRQATAVTVTDDMSEIDPNLKYVWTQRDTMTPEESEFTNYFTNGNIIEKANGDGEWYLWVLAKDSLGHKTIQRSNVFYMDNTMPTLQVQYTTLSPTNRSVTATITANEIVKPVDGWRLSEDKHTLIKEYTENAEEQVTVSDLAGNEQNVTIRISNIIKNGPKVTFSPNGNTIPQKKVEVNVEVVKNLANINESTLKYMWMKGETRPEIADFTNTLTNGQKVVKEGEDGNWYLWILAYDVLGNETIEKSQMFKLDNTNPSIEVRYSNIALTNQNVTAIIHANEKVQEVEGWSLSEDKQTLTKEYKQNVTETIRIQDLAGNETTTNIIISNIDKTAPITNITYSTTEMTNQNVIATITSDKEIQEIRGWTLSENKKVLTKEYTQNTNETVLVSDIAGNSVSMEVNISNIDKKGPNLQVEYKAKENKIILVWIKSDEEVQEVESWTRSENKKVLSKEYSENTRELVTVKDKLGNITTIQINVTDIDAIPAIVEVKYSTKEETDNPVIVTLQANERVQKVEGWTLSEDQMKLTKTYEKNTTEKITIKDLSGNVTEVQVKIENIRSIQKGDINKDGTVDITDLFHLKRHLIAGNKTNWLLTAEQKQYADMNQDSIIDITDLFLMKRVILRGI